MRRPVWNCTALTAGVPPSLPLAVLNTTLKSLIAIVKSDGNPTTLKADEMLYLEGGAPHAVRALADSVALLTIYDMCKAVDRGMVMSGIRVLEKHGGKSGDWSATS